MLCYAGADVTRGRAMSENQAQDAAAETERPDRPRGARVVRTLWIPAFVALAGALGYAGTAMWADEIAGASGLTVGRAMAGPLGGSRVGRKGGGAGAQPGGGRIGARRCRSHRHDHHPGAGRALGR